MFIIAYHFGFCGKHASYVCRKHASYKGDGLYIDLLNVLFFFSSSKEPKC